MRKQKKHWEVTTDEALNFYNSLKIERETFKLSIEELLKSEIIIGEKAVGKIAGIAGIRRYRMLPILFIVVKSEFQNNRLGKLLMERLHRIAKTRYSFVVLSVFKENKKAINLFKNFGYYIFKERSDLYYLILPINIIGKFVAYFLLLMNCFENHRWKIGKN